MRLWMGGLEEGSVGGRRVRSGGSELPGLRAGDSALGGLQLPKSVVPEPRLPETPLIGSRLPVTEDTDRYVASVVRRYAVGGGAVRAAESLLPLIGEWAGKRLWGVELSGSHAKGTATALGTDVDLFISLAPDGIAVKESFWSLVEFLAARGLRPQVRNVSVRVEVGGCKVDLVVGRAVSSQLSAVSESADRRRGGRLGAAEESRSLRQAQGRLFAALRMTRGTGTRRTAMTGRVGLGFPHTLYRRGSDTWIQTDIRKHVAVVREAGCAEEIRALKIWRERWAVEWPSFYLELVAVRELGGFTPKPQRTAVPRVGSAPTLGHLFRREGGAPSGNERGGIASRVLRVLEFVAGGGLEMRVVDPANSNNVVSDELEFDERRALVVAARKSLAKESWEQVVW